MIHIFKLHILIKIAIYGKYLVKKYILGCKKSVNKQRIRVLYPAVMSYP